jgi:hypothetical protein
MFNPQIDKCILMCKHITDKHVGEINDLTLHYVVTEYEDFRTGGLIEQLTPVLLIDFK